MPTLKIPKVPQKKHLGNKENREQMIKKWIKLLEQLNDFGTLERGLTTKCGFVNDNKYLFENSVLVFRIDANLNYHEEAYLFLFCCFNNDGRFQIVYDGNYEDFPNLTDCSANVLMNYKNTETDSWEDGYYLMVKIIQESFFEKKETKPFSR